VEGQFVMSAPSAKVIADSIADGVRLTTMEVTMHRFVLAEFNTHRQFSRNSASSRAIPFAKQVAKVMDDPAIPLVWASEKKGMQGGEEVSPVAQANSEAVWLTARTTAVSYATRLHDWGVHKSITNRLLEPFMWHKVIVSSTEWDNFFDQRCSPLAQPEIRAAADAMALAMAASQPRELTYGQMHAPFVPSSKMAEVMNGCPEEYLSIAIRDLRMAVSAARCARVSYLTHDGKVDVGADMELFTKLVTADPPHWSPLEHVAFVTAGPPYTDVPGNFGSPWLQLRHIIAGAESSPGRKYADEFSVGWTSEGYVPRVGD
jgi:hypothetical protein